MSSVLQNLTFNSDHGFFVVEMFSFCAEKSTCTCQTLAPMWCRGRWGGGGDGGGAAADLQRAELQLHSKASYTTTVMSPDLRSALGAFGFTWLHLFSWPPTRLCDRVWADPDLCSSQLQKCIYDQCIKLEQLCFTVEAAVRSVQFETAAAASRPERVTKYMGVDGQGGRWQVWTDEDTSVQDEERTSRRSEDEGS